ncbi:MAG: hypothetical protein AB7O67_19425 [Vicinamibacterales bacterium]
MAGGLAACQGQPDPRQTGFQVDRDNVSAQYDPSSGRLRRLTVDRDRDGFVETVSIWDGSQLLRIEVDTDEDGIVDRWEHYDGTPPVMVSIGGSTRNDGVEDMWSYPSADGRYVARIETDTTRDARVDKWEEYDAPRAPEAPPVLRAVGLDPGGLGHPTRWVRYHPDGSFDRVETVP